MAGGCIPASREATQLRNWLDSSTQMNICICTDAISLQQILRALHCNLHSAPEAGPLACVTGRLALVPLGAICAVAISANSSFFYPMIGHHCGLGQQVWHARAATCGPWCRAALGQGREGEAVGGLSHWPPDPHWAFCLSGQQDDAASEQVCLPTEPQEQKQWFCGWVKPQGMYKRMHAVTDLTRNQMHGRSYQQQTQRKHHFLLPLLSILLSSFSLLFKNSALRLECSQWTFL